MGTGTRLIASLSKKQSSKATKMYNYGIKTLKLNASYLGFSVENINKKLKELKDKGFYGFTISIPFKEKALNYVDKTSKDARSIGAINTIVKKNNEFIGYNTDWIGAVTALKKKIRLRNKGVILIGAGGVAKAIAYGLSKERCKVTIFNRTIKKAKKLSGKHGFKYNDLKEIKSIRDYDVLINATSIDLIKNRIVSKSILVRNKIIIDVIFDPTKTSLIKEAKKRGCKTVSGLDILVYQAIAQFKIFFNKKPSFQTLEKAYKNG
jgi:shikimate dehydrogenase